MNYKMIKNDIIKTKLITLTTTLFICFASMLVSLAIILTVNLVNAIDTMMERAKTPHFMQMHSGEIDISNINQFAKQNNKVNEFQILEFLNIDNSNIQLGEHLIYDSTQDIGLSVQSNKFDYLFDLDGNIINTSVGELYIPTCYINIANIGDKAIICGKEFTVVGFLRDSQMNSNLSSSKRFLVSKEDFEQIKEFGNIEYLIEFRLNDLSAINTFSSEYINAGLPSNGPTITYPLFKMINGISDGIMIGLILLISIVVVSISLLCIRFTLITKIENDYQEIGVMKAIGLRVNDIKKIYISKYTVISLIGCILGFAISIVLKQPLLKNIQLMMGETKNTFDIMIFGLMGVLAVFCIIIIFVNRVLNRFKKISASEAIRFGVEQQNHIYTKFCISKNSWININIFLGIKNIFSNKKLYITNLVILVFAVFIMIVPQNLYSTISSKNFITYMGIGNCDLRIDIQQTNSIFQKANEINKAMQQDNSILKHSVLVTKSFKIRMNGIDEKLQIELGNHNIFPISYFKGKAPTNSNEIAISAIYSNDLNKNIGDTITLITDEGQKTLTVCGIYSDITNGGKTAKATFTDYSTNIMWAVIYAELINPSIIGETVQKYSNEFKYARVTDIQEYTIQTYGQILNSIKQASITGSIIAITIMVLITLLFIRMLVAKDRYSIAVMKASGFTNSDIKFQYISRSVFILIIGIVIGTALTNTLGEMISGIAISSFGVVSFKFIISPILAYLVYPLIMGVFVLAATVFGVSNIRNIKIYENIKE